MSCIKKKGKQSANTKAKEPGHRRIVSFSGIERPSSFARQPKKNDSLYTENSNFAIESQNQWQKRMNTEDVKKKAKKSKSKDLELATIEPIEELSNKDKIILNLFSRLFKKPPIFFQRLNSYLTKSNISLESFCLNLGKYEINFNDLNFEGNTQMNEIFANGLSLDLFRTIYSTYYSKTRNSYSEISQLLKKLEMNLQLHRIPKTDLRKHLSKGRKHLSIEDLKDILKRSPCKLKKQEEIDKLAKFLYSNSFEKTMKKLEKNTEDWVIFSYKEEEEFDQKLFVLLSRHKVSIKKLFQIFDSEDTGIISVDKFFNLFKDLKEHLEPGLVHYLKLLFFSFTHDLETAPYAYFLKAYSQPIEDFEIEEQNRAKIVRENIRIIAKAFIKKEKVVRHIFIDGNDRIYFDSFAKGLEKLDVCLSKDAQSQLFGYLKIETEYFIDGTEFEELLESYGVPIN